MALRIVKNIAAENDLVDIWIYSFDKWGTAQADKYLDQLDDGIQFLAENPLAGTKCDDIRKGYFSYPIKKHVIFYILENEALRVIRVLGGEMNLSKHLK